MYNFPPDPAVGGLRWQEMSRTFAQHGWAVDVVTRDFAGVEGADRARLERLPVGIRVFSVADREPLVGRAQKIVWPLARKLFRPRQQHKADALSQEEIFQQQGPRQIIRAYHVWLEFARDENWARAAAAVGGAVMRGTRYSAVISSGPPHMAHEAGRILAARTNVPHVIDMRDPWSLVQRLREPIASPMWVQKARAYESRAVRAASLVTMNTRAARDAMRAAYRRYAEKIEVIRNGSDDEPLPEPHHDKCFRLRFAGWIYMDRDPRPVFQAAQKLVTKYGLTPDQFVMEFVGHANRYAGKLTTQIAEEEGVLEYVKISGHLPRRQAMEFLSGATMLLSLPQDSDFAIPAKIYEYVRFHAWMLVLATPQSATADLLRDTDADVVHPADVDGIVRSLMRRYEQFAAGVMPLPIGRDGRFDRSVQAKKLMELVEKIDRKTG